MTSFPGHVGTFNSVHFWHDKIRSDTTHIYKMNSFLFCDIIFWEKTVIVFTKAFRKVQNKNAGNPITSV